MNRRSFFQMALGAVATLVAAPVLKLTKRLTHGATPRNLRPYSEADAARMEQIMRENYEAACQAMAFRSGYVGQAPISVPCIIERTSGKQLTPLAYDAWTPETGWYHREIKIERNVKFRHLSADEAII
jgi:hypothetical protein